MVSYLNMSAKTFHVSCVFVLSLLGVFVSQVNAQCGCNGTYDWVLLGEITNPGIYDVASNYDVLIGVAADSMDAGGWIQVSGAEVSAPGGVIEFQWEGATGIKVYVLPAGVGGGGSTVITPATNTISSQGLATVALRTSACDALSYDWVAGTYFPYYPFDLGGGDVVNALDTNWNVGLFDSDSCRELSVETWGIIYNPDPCPGVDWSPGGTVEFGCEEWDLSITAVPDPGYYFVGWTGERIDANVIDVNSEALVVGWYDHAFETLYANFALKKYNFILSSSAGGSIVYPGEGEFEFYHGETFSLDAQIDDPLFEFSRYIGSLASPTNPYRYFTVTGNGAIRAIFHSLEHILYVDGSIPAGQYENGTDEYPFDTLQEAVEVAPDGATLVIRSGTYCENLELPLKSLTLTGVDVNDANDWAFPVIEGVGDGPVVTRHWGADAPVLLQGLVIRGGNGRTAGAVDCRETQMTLANCLITGNRSNNVHGRGGAVFAYDSQVNLVNCTVSGNYSSSKGAALYAGKGSVVSVFDSILWGNVPMEIYSDESSDVVVQYSDIADLTEGEGNLNRDPLFVSPGHWVHALNPTSIVSAFHAYATWNTGDYHLDVNSPCVDAGDPNESGDDMGAYGNTSEATVVSEE